MNKLLAFGLFLLISSRGFAQVVGRVDKKTKEFSVVAGQKVNYIVLGYQFANAATPKLICFASDENVARANSTLRLGSYFDSNGLPPGASIMYLGMAGTFGKMNFIAAGKATVFYVPKANYVIK